MPFDQSLFRLERFNAELSYHAAFAFWTFRGVLAETWAHGPYFGATTELGTQQVTLTPAPDETEDKRLQAIYGLRAAGLLAEGPHWVPRAPDLAKDWIRDVVSVLQPKRTVAVHVQLFGLYPVSDPIKASRRLRNVYYRNEALQQVLIPRHAAMRDRYHSALELFIDTGDGDTSMIIGVVGPPHEGQFFTYPDKERDSRWWMGFRYDTKARNQEGIDHPDSQLAELIDDAQADFATVTKTVFTEVID